jgi:hypothetical protein
MNQRNIVKIIEKLDRIQTGKFGIDDVEILLINIREFARRNSFLLLLEFCDSVAHPDRNQGIIYDELDVLYSKFKYMPTNAGDQLDYYNISKEVFTLLFQKSVDQMTEEFLQENLNMNSNQLKRHISKNLVLKKNSAYSAINEHAKNELRSIQEVLIKIPPQVHVLTESKLFNELEICLSSLSKSIGFSFSQSEFENNRNNVLMCFMEIIQNCHFVLHDGKIAQGFISIGKNNSLYDSDPKTDNLNISFSAIIPIIKSFAIIEIIQTGLLVGSYIPDLNSVIAEWLNDEHTSGRLKQFGTNRK